MVDDGGLLAGLVGDGRESVAPEEEDFKFMEAEGTGEEVVGGAMNRGEVLCCLSGSLCSSRVVGCMARRPVVSSSMRASIISAMSAP